METPKTHSHVALVPTTFLAFPVGIVPNRSAGSESAVGEQGCGSGELAPATVLSLHANS
jgi:hypothetical protein